MARLTATLFGAPCFAVDGVPISLDHRKPAALLTYLLLTGQAHTRDHLATLFWPEHAQARTFLRNNLYVIRKALGEAAAQWLYADRNTIHFRPDSAVWVDLFAFRDCLAVCSTACQREQAVCPNCVAQWERALTLYRDDFLAGFTLRDCPAFDEWRFFQNERLRHEFVVVLEKLTIAYSQQANWSAAIAVGQRRLAMDPFVEEAQRALIRLYAQAGQPAAALRQYEECKRIFATELQSAPDEETEALYDAIKARKYPLLPAHQPRDDGPTTARDQRQPAPSVSTTTQSSSLQGLPLPVTPLLGREQEQTELRSLLCRPDVRLVTLTGPGGVGKTRLGLQVVATLRDAFADGVYFVPLAPLGDANQLAWTIMQAIGLRETSRQSSLETVLTTLQSKQLLLVLDNFEHLIAAAPLVTTLLERCRALKLLVTSRERLRIQGEREFVLPALALPIHSEQLSPEALAAYPAVQLFLQRTQASMPAFRLNQHNAAAVAAICAQLDGLPLAIELAAGRVKFFLPPRLLEKLTGTTTPTSLDLLTHGSRDLPERHQTLRQTMAWSYELLDSAEQQLFRRLSVFVDSFSLEAATALCAAPTATEGYMGRGLQIYWPSEEFSDAQSVSEQVKRPDAVTPAILDGVTSLVDKSLVKCLPQPDGETRFMLLETVRAYGLELLDLHDELGQTQRAHAGYYLLLAIEAQPYLHGRTEHGWLQRLAIEHHNLHAVLDWAVAQDDALLAMRLGVVLQDYWRRTSYYHEGIERMKVIATLAENASPSFASSRFFFNLALSVGSLKGKTATTALYERSLAASRASGDQFTAGNCLNKLGGLAYHRGDYATWEVCVHEAEPLKLNAGGHYTHAIVTGFTGLEYIQLGRFAEGRILCERSLTLHRELGDTWGLCISLHNYIQAMLLQGDIAKATTLAEEYMELACALNADYLIALAQTKMGQVALARAEHLRAQTLLHTALQTHRHRQRYDAQIDALKTFAALAVAQQQPVRAYKLVAFLAQYFATTDYVLPPVLQQNFDRLVTSARQKLSADEAAAAWATGSKLTLAQAVMLALGEEVAGVGE